MNVKDFLNKASSDEIAREIARLAASDDPNSITILSDFLIYRYDIPPDKQVIPYLACRGLLQKNTKGVEQLVKILNQIDGYIYPLSIIDSLWSASNGELSEHMFRHLKVYSPLDEELSLETIESAKDAFYQFIIECHTDPESFYRFSSFLHMRAFSTAGEQANYTKLQTGIFDVLSDSTIKITHSLINKFESLLEEETREEDYQKFLEKNPVFIDPLAFKVINKHQLGSDLITDFVIETLKGEYILVEIEKPQDKIFTQNNDFSSHFSHAFGQVIGFLDWVDNNIAYAQTKLPGILNPKGLLIMGRSKDLNSNTSSKLKRFNKNSNDIKVLTYDDILYQSKNLYKNLRK